MQQDSVSISLPQPVARMFLEIVKQKVDDFALRLYLQLVTQMIEKQAAMGDKIARDEHRIDDQHDSGVDKHVVCGEDQCGG